jgi:hypothetical protein
LPQIIEPAERAPRVQNARRVGEIRVGGELGRVEGVEGGFETCRQGSGILKERGRMVMQLDEVAEDVPRETA